MKLLIVEDDPVITDTVTVCFNLRWPDAKVIATESGEECLKLVRSESPDVIILDVGLPGMDGWHTLRQIRERSDASVIMLTAKDSEVAKVKGLEWGADDYITKPFSHIELLARVRSVMRRTPVSSPEEEQGTYSDAAAGLEIDFDSRGVNRHGKPVNLAPLEYGLLYQLVSHRGKVLPHETLLSRVWGPEYSDEVDYLKVYIRRLRTKLGDDPQKPELIHTERGVGYMYQVRARPQASSQSSPEAAGAD